MRKTLLIMLLAPLMAVAQDAYEWRGAMLDLSRHFFPVSHIHRQIDMLHSCGINRLHLHLTDAAGWRMEIKALPRLTDVAAWRTADSWQTWWDGDRGYCDRSSGFGGFYTQDELRAVVAHADSLGIIVVPEIEMPGHSEEIFAAYPELLCEGGRVSGAGVEHGQAQADFCAGSELTFEYIFKILDEVMDVFPSPYIHIGGDEAGRQMWATCGRCQERMREHGFQTTAQMQAWFMRRVADYLTAHGRRAVCWDEVLEGWLEMEKLTAGGNDGQTATPKPVIMCWRGQAKGAEAVSQGFEVVMCPGEYCYLDNAQDAPCTQPEANGGYLPFDKVYSYNPEAGIEGGILGLQGNLWAEYIPSPEHAEYMLYPRILALAFIGNKYGYDAETARGLALEAVINMRMCGYHPFPLDSEVGERGATAETLTHKARGCKVTYNNRYSPQYAAAGDGSLTDGIRGGWANNDGRWQGFIGQAGMDVVIDLGETRQVRRVACDFQQICQPWIFQPAHFIVSISEDGATFETVYERDAEVRFTRIPTIERREWSLPATADGTPAQDAAAYRLARYVRVQALPHTVGAWIFCDEIVVD